MESVVIVKNQAFGALSGMFLRMYKNELKILSRCYCSETKFNAATRSLESHPFCKPPFTNYAQLTSHLLENIIYNSNGLLILNRPHGLKKDEIRERGFWLKKIRLPTSPALQTTEMLTFVGVLPYLKEKLQIKHLEVLKAPDRKMSGISILSYDHKLVSKRVRKAFTSGDEPKYTYLAVCCNIPFKDSVSIKLGVTLAERNNVKRVMFLENFSKRALKSKRVLSLTLNHKILSTNEELQVCLVELEVNKTHWSLLPAYCAMRMISPALGDVLYGSCAQRLHDKNIAVDPFSPAAHKPYKVPTSILNALELNSKQLSVIPLHIHLAKLNFHKYATDGRIFTARPPEHFLWTCEKLGLPVPNEYLQNSAFEKLAKQVPSADEDNSRSSDSENELTDCDHSESSDSEDELINSIESPRAADDCSKSRNHPHS